jgi:hypothetical protein
MIFYYVGQWIAQTIVLYVVVYCSSFFCMENSRQDFFCSAILYNGLFFLSNFSLKRNANDVLVSKNHRLEEDTKYHRNLY